MATSVAFDDDRDQTRREWKQRLLEAGQEWMSRRGVAEPPDLAARCGDVVDRVWSLLQIQLRHSTDEIVWQRFRASALRLLSQSDGELADRLP